MEIAARRKRKEEGKIKVKAKEGKSYRKQIWEL